MPEHGRGGLNRLGLAIGDVLLHENIETYDCVTGVFLDVDNPARTDKRLRSEERDAFLIGDDSLIIAGHRDPEEFGAANAGDDTSAGVEDIFDDPIIDALSRGDAGWALGPLAIFPRSEVRDIRRSAKVPDRFGYLKTSRSVLGFAKVTLGDAGIKIHFWLDPEDQLARPDKRITGKGVSRHLSTFFDHKAPDWVNRGLCTCSHPQQSQSLEITLGCCAPRSGAQRKNGS